MFPPQGLPPNHGEEICAPQIPEELCWWERKLLPEASMQERSQGRSQMKCIAWSSTLGFGVGLIIPLQKNLRLQNLQNPRVRSMEEAKTHTRL
jgi:hypothetical protein